MSHKPSNLQRFCSVGIAARELGVSVDVVMKLICAGLLDAESSEDGIVIIDVDTMPKARAELRRMRNDPDEV
jgi:hypothetical protein